MKKINFKQKIFYLFIIFGVFIVSMSSVMLFEINKNATVKDILNKSSIKFKERELFLTNSLDQFGAFVSSFKDSISFRNSISTNDYKILQNMFISRIKSHPNIIQIRFINLEGNEIARVDRLGSQIEVIPQSKLQNKSKRYYFKEIIGIDNKSIWYSKIDLNKENGKIEKPIKPVIRVGTPIYIDGIKKGILIINISIAKILENLSQTTLYNIYLIDKYGYFILHKPNDYDKKDYSFSKYLNLNYKVQDHFINDYKFILGNSQYQGKNFYSKTINRYYGEEVKMILEIKHKIVENIFDIFKEKLIIVLLLSIIISIPFAYMISGMVERNREKLERELASQKDELKIKELNLEKQSKMAQMGEMIGNIAHQWRQPLQSIAGTAGSVKIQSEFGLTQEDELQEAMRQIEEQTEYLSEVIDIFRNFSRGDKIVEYVIIQERIDNALSIINMNIITKQIKIIKDIDYSKELEVAIVKGELTQVIVNIINNAKDILLEREVEDAWIKISLNKKANKAIIMIEDNGGGIPKDVLPKIFDPYFTTKHKSQGIGLGLNMSYNIVVNSLKGDLYAQNTQNGAKFFIELPLNRDITDNLNLGENIG